MATPNEGAVSREALEALGLLVVNFNYLELVLSDCIGSLIGGQDFAAKPDADKIGRIITTELSFKALVAAFCSLYRYRISDPNRLDAMDALRKALLKAEKKRNEFFHSLWVADSSGATTRLKATAKAKSGFRMTKESLSVSDILSAATEASVLAAATLDETFAALGWL